MSSEKILIAADHAGFDLKEHFKSTLKNIQWIDLGPSSSDRVDYPDYAGKLAQAILSGQATKGVLICGSGIGMSIAANRFKGIRAAHAESVQSGTLSKQHNNANVLCLGARLSSPALAIEIFKGWNEASFEGGRHTDRINKLD